MFKTNKHDIIRDIQESSNPIVILGNVENLNYLFEIEKYHKKRNKK